MENGTSKQRFWLEQKFITLSINLSTLIVCAEYETNCLRGRNLHRRLSRRRKRWRPRRRPRKLPRRRYRLNNIVRICASNIDTIFWWIVMIILWFELIVENYSVGKETESEPHCKRCNHSNSLKIPPPHILFPGFGRRGVNLVFHQVNFHLTQNHQNTTLLLFPWFFKELEWWSRQKVNPL